MTRKRNPEACIINMVLTMPYSIFKKGLHYLFSRHHASNCSSTLAFMAALFHLYFHQKNVLLYVFSRFPYCRQCCGGNFEFFCYIFLFHPRFIFKFFNNSNLFGQGDGLALASYIHLERQQLNTSETASRCGLDPLSKVPPSVFAG